MHYFYGETTRQLSLAGEHHENVQVIFKNEFQDFKTPGKNVTYSVWNKMVSCWLGVNRAEVPSTKYAFLSTKVTRKLTNGILM